VLHPILRSSWKPLLLAGRNASTLILSVSFQSTAVHYGERREFGFKTKQERDVKRAIFRLRQGGNGRRRRRVWVERRRRLETLSPRSCAACSWIH
jgi:hypothetical protein